MHLASLKIKEESGDKDGIAISYNNIGNIYMYQGNFPEALKMNYTSLKIYEEIGDKEGIATSFINLGNLYTKLNNPKEAGDYLNKALQLSKELGSNDDFRETYAGLVVLDSMVGNYKAAFEYNKLCVLYRDSLNNEETKKKSLQASMQYEYDKKEIATKAEQDKRDAINVEEKKKQQIVIYAVAGILILVVVFAVFMYNRFKITQKQKQVIEEQKVLVDKAYETLHEKNKEVMDSIHYAKRIQTALITSERYVATALNRLTKN
jgi:tetratricopeptide (TPR) repeat protein